MNMVIFGLLGAVLLAGLVYSLVRTLRRPPQAASPKADEQAIVAIYQNRLQQVERQFGNGELDKQEYQQAQDELSKGLAYELQNQAPQKKGSQKSAPGNAVTWGLAFGIPLFAVSLYLLLGKPEALDPAALNGQLSIPEMVSRLEKRLKKNPEDVQGWRMLGRSYTVMENFPAARDAYGAAYQREPENSEVILDYAEAVARANGNSLLGKPAELVEEALKHDAANIRALVLKGVWLFHQEDIRGAIQQWRTVLRQPQIDEQTRAVVQNLIDRSTELAGDAVSSAGAAESTPVQAPVAAAAAAVTVELSLSPQLSGQVVPEDTVFVFAQAANGPKMPLAVMRKRVADLPFKIVLDDSSAMTETMKLSAFNQVVVTARVSKSGNPTAASGDLQGKSAVIDPSKKPSLKLVIDTKLP
jgi:cytochrome c-type biogenesis protein CcmH